LTSRTIFSAGSGRCAHGARLALLLGAPLLAGTALAQVREPVPEERDNTPEAFAAVDPYTKGDAELLARLGYQGSAPFGLAGRTTTSEVEEVLGGIPILWVQTKHFVLASSLRTYRLVGDQQEAAKIEGELDRLEKRLGRLKRPRNELDPWLRLHLYAQRLEELYASFCADLRLTDRELATGIIGPGPYLGQKEKFVVLLLQQSSSVGRYTQRFAGIEQKFSYRISFPEGGCAFVVAAEALRDANYELDAALHCYVADSVAVNLCDAFRLSWGSVPLWFKYGLAHRYSRRIDPRWSIYEGASNTTDQREDAWRWEPRVRGLVANEVLPPWERMLAWRNPDEMDLRAHMMAWSSVDWLLERKEARPLAFLLAVTEPPPGGAAEVSPELQLERQRAGLKEAFGESVAELDAAWRTHVERRYERK